MKQTVYALHTGLVLIEPLKSIFRELLPEARLVNLVDDGLLADVRAAGGLISSITRKVISYGLLAQAAGADAIFSCCSSLGEAADLLAKALDIPVVKIDDAMARRAVELGPRIAVVATVESTLQPTRLLIERHAAAAKASTVRCYLVDGAFDALMAGNAAGHDGMIMAAITQAALENDVVALAQGSMARLVPLLDRPPIPVLSSPRLGVEALRGVLLQAANAATPRR